MEWMCNVAQTAFIKFLLFHKFSFSIQSTHTSFGKKSCNKDSCHSNNIALKEGTVHILYLTPEIKLTMIIIRECYFRRNLDYFQNFHLTSMTTVDPDTGNGEVTIRMPPESHPLISGKFYVDHSVKILCLLTVAAKPVDKYI